MSFIYLFITHESATFSPSQRVVENYPPFAGLELVDEDEVFVSVVVVDSETRTQGLHGETARRVFKKLPHFCHRHPAAGHDSHRRSVFLRLPGMLLLIRTKVEETSVPLPLSFIRYT